MFRDPRFPIDSAKLSIMLFVAVGIPLFAQVPGGTSQTPDPAYVIDKAKVADAIATVKTGDFSIYHIDVIEKANALEAIPSLELQFAKTQDAPVKGKIAASLVRLGDRNDLYWNYLADKAAAAVGNDAPAVTRDDGKPGVSAQFAKWADQRGMTTEMALGTMYDFANAVALLAEAKDPRGIPLLRKALFSSYFLIQTAAAKGLRDLQDKDSIPIMIEACRKSPTTASVIALSLVNFDDPRAQAAFVQYVPSDLAKALLEAKEQRTKAGALPKTEK